MRTEATARPSPAATTAFAEVVPMSMPAVTSTVSAPSRPSTRSSPQESLVHLGQRLDHGVAVLGRPGGGHDHEKGTRRQRFGAWAHPHAVGDLGGVLGAVPPPALA